MTGVRSGVAKRAGFVTLALAMLAGLTGCVGLPDDGPVVESQIAGGGTATEAMAINPVGPQPGQSPAEVVKGFLDAMQATPIRTDVARQFLSTVSQASWDPTATITYIDASLPQTAGGSSVVVTLSGADRIDPRGAWQGALRPAQSELAFTVVRDGEDFRISQPPDALIVPQTWFVQRFRQVSLYFFEPTGQVLVPDPVFVPRGADLASILVQRLIAGPATPLRGYVRNLLDLGVDSSSLEVPVSSAGVATIDLVGEDLEVPDDVDRDLLLAQLTWTLRQDTSVDAVRVRFNGTDLTAGSGGVNVSTGGRFAPYDADASTLLFGLDEGRLVAGGAQNLAPVSGPFGQGDLALRTITPDLGGSRAAGVTEDGTAMFVGVVRTSDVDAAQLTQVVAGGTSLLPPSWDFSGRLWIVDRRADGAVVSYVNRETTSELTIPGVSGEDVKSFLVSRDGSRLVAVIRGRSEDVVVVSRLLQNSDGRVVGALEAQQVDVQGGRGLRIRDMTWLSPTSIVVLHPIGPRLFQVRSASVDGAPSGLDDLSVTLDGKITGLAGSPDPRLDTYAISEEALIYLVGPGGGEVAIRPGLTSLGYVG
ncbi:LpqB family beta-propeller domain-containing protein [Nocardioides sp.]|uniref:LpqB family beta-propeller domain-containing protein n=1 Tax=Nocardioides sp. TaxID=35761 RepID=UPI0035657D09